MRHETLPLTLSICLTHFTPVGQVCLFARMATMRAEHVSGACGDSACLITRKQASEKLSF